MYGGWDGTEKFFRFISFEGYAAGFEAFVVMEGYDDVG